MPRSKGNAAIDTTLFDSDMAAHPENYFSASETERRMKETMSRLFGRSPTMNLDTGQNLKPPFLTADDLKARGYPCNSGLE